MPNAIFMSGAPVATMNIDHAAFSNHVMTESVAAPAPKPSPAMAAPQMKTTVNLDNATRLSTSTVDQRRFSRMQAVELNNPRFALAYAQFTPNFGDLVLAGGVTRDLIHVPISPIPEPTDAVLFSDPSDAATKYYIPRYRLRQIDQQRYDIAVTPADEGGWRLTAGLERYPAPELGSIAGAREFPHKIAVFFLYRGGPSFAIEMRVDFTEQFDSSDHENVAVAAHLTFEQRNELLFALKTAAAAPKLIVRRAIDVAVKIEAPPAQPQPQVLRRASMTASAPSASTTLMFQPRTATKDGAQFTQFQAVDAQLVASTPPPVDRYRLLTRALDDVADPEVFVLDPLLHAYFYAGLGAASAGPAEFRRHQLAYPKGMPSARLHTYLQSKAEPWIFYYLPDSFKLSRRETPRFFPRMVVRLAAPDGEVEKASATMDYIVEPFIDAARIAAATAELKGQIPASASKSQPDLHALQTPSAALRLWKPTAAGAVEVERKDLAIDLANGFHDSLTLPLNDFATLFGAACSHSDSSLFTGNVIVNAGISTELIPIAIRFGDAQGEILSFTEQPSDTTGTIAVELTNSIESPVRIAGLPVRVRRGDNEAAAVVEGTTFDPPVELAPDARLSFTVRPLAPLPGNGVLDAIFDTSRVEVLADAQRILPLLCDPSVPAQYERQIEVNTMDELLADPDNPSKSVIVVAVEFKDSGVLKLKRDQLAGVAQIRLPLMDLLLGRDVQGKYKFRQQVVRADRTVTADSVWREADTGVLFVPIP